MSRTSPADDRRPRLGVFLDYRFRQVGGRLSSERAFALFVFGLAERAGALTVIGRLDPGGEPLPYAAPPEVRLAPLPFYSDLTRPLRALGALLAGVPRLWRTLDDLDAVWVLGPNPLAIVLAVMALVRRRTVVLGVRQDTRAYVRSRHPGRRLMILAADVMDLAFRALARACAVAVVGGQVAERYRHARRLHVLVVSLVRERDLAPARTAAGGRVMTVGRIDAEKNPLLLADVLADLCADGADWLLDVYGDGPLRAELESRAAALGIGDRVAFHGYVPVDGGLLEAYREADAFLHVSWTEGVPQVLLEAFAAGLPVVATDVGGVAGLTEGAALLVPPGDAAAAAAALRRVRGDEDLCATLTAAGAAVARRHTLEAETGRLHAFLAEAAA